MDLEASTKQNFLPHCGVVRSLQHWPLSFSDRSLLLQSWLHHQLRGGARTKAIGFFFPFLISSSNFFSKKKKGEQNMAQKPKTNNSTA